jgi:hypothetical protein
MGLMQINSRNLGALNITVADAFDPCRNLWAGARILTSNYLQAAKTEGLGGKALLEAISAYNTGNFRAGFSNGYVRRVVSNLSRSHATQPHATEPADEGQVCWASSCVTVSLSQAGRWLTITSGVGIAVLIGYFFRIHPWARDSIGAGLQALWDILLDILRCLHPGHAVAKSDTLRVESAPVPVPVADPDAATSNSKTLSAPRTRSTP